ncbi:hypothetical protein LAZ67_3004867 [Cordylochernes scorpioides]|uniref:HTH CENPB-type domain-containing protein n=1 Tax=Cordylochernes scorpioides TaxID=51811 RepID=A0ABY6KD81_9ARAC|nr:hypothetical protein LAZ67_3004867 [Cordylochernes scorpioides]
MKIIEEIEQGKSHRQVSRERNIPRSTFGTILKNKFAIKSAFLKSNFSSTLKRDRDREFPEIEKSLFRKAILLALKTGQDNFEASNGWLEKLKARRNIAFNPVKRLHGEAGSVDANSVATWKGEIILSLLAKYSQQDIFNADETGLFYKLLPNQTMTIRGEKCEGGKKSKERITVLDDWGNFYGLAEKKLDQIFKRRERKILLILDNCPALQIPEGLQNIEIRFLPALTTSALQPCDMVHLLFAISWLEAAWVGVSSSTIKNCFSHSGFVMDEAMEEIVEEEMNRCFEALKQHQAIDVNYIDFLEVDKDVQVAGEQSIEEIVKETVFIGGGGSADGLEGGQPPDGSSDTSGQHGRLQHTALVIDNLRHIGSFFPITTLATPPLPLKNKAKMDCNFSPTTKIEPLTGTNYPIWALKVGALLRGKKLFKCVISDPEPDIKDEVAWKIWSVKNDEAFGIIVTTLSDEQAGKFLDETKAKKVWDELKKIYTGNLED